MSKKKSKFLVFLGIDFIWAVSKLIFLGKHSWRTYCILGKKARLEGDLDHRGLALKPGTSFCVFVVWSEMLTQELMIEKCEDAETKNSCWAKELVKISTIILQHNRITKLPVPWKIQIKVWYTPLSCFYRKPTHVPMKPADHKNIDPQLVEARRWMMLETSSWCQPIQELSMSWSCPVPWTL